jgi:excisionase family DNA binding protein
VANQRTPRSNTEETAAGDATGVLDTEPLCDAAFVGAFLDIPAKTVLQYARDGRLPGIRIGKHVRFRLSEVEATLDAQRVL